MRERDAMRTTDRVTACRTTRRRPLAVALLLCTLTTASGLSADTEPASPSRLDALSWMAGCWDSAEGSASADECWLERRGNVMMGFHVDVFGNGRVFFEYLRIVEEADAVNYLASPMGGEPTAFRLVESDGHRAVFENPQHDWPQRITYWREGNSLHARAEGLDETSRKATWVWELRSGR